MSDYNPQDPQYNQAPPQYYAAPPPPPPAAPDNKGKAVAALVIGIIALIVSWAVGWVPFVSLLPLVLAIIGLAVSVSARKEATASSGLATGGLVCSIIALVFSGVFFVSCTLCTVCTAGAAGLGSIF